DIARVPRVLIVDDEEPTTLSFARMLQLEGYDVETAFDAETGLRVACASALDAVLLDLRMPLVDGVEFLRRLRATPSGRRIPVAIVTGYYLTDDQTLAEIEDLGAVLQYKPLFLDDMIALTRTLLRR